MPTASGSIVLGCIADDYTGASDLASTLVREGLRTVQTIGVPDPSLALPETDAVVVALKSRSVEPAEAVRLSERAEAWLRERGAGHVMFKICSTFDSTDRGNIGPVLDALRARVDGGTGTAAGCVPVTPGFVETGRTVYMGHLFVHGVPLHESPLKDHPLNPMRDPDLRRVLARQSGSPVGSVPLPVVEEGPDAIRARLDALRAAGSPAAIVDGVASRHFAALGEAARSLPLSVGASGLGYGLARAFRRADAAGIPDATAGFETHPGRAAILAGSCSAATLRQIAAVSDRIPRLALDVSAILAGAPEAERAVAWAREHRDDPLLISSSDAPDAVRELQREHGAARTGHAIEQVLAAVAEALVADGVTRLVVAGGETSGAVVDRLRIPAFRIGPEIAPGVPVLRALGGGSAAGGPAVGGPAAGPDLLLALKSGNFGADSFFSDALALMGG